MQELVFREATLQDAKRLLDIYAEYIDTTITFETETPSLEEFSRRIAEYTETYPYLICERGDKVVGYAYAHRQFSRAAYAWGAELSVYLAPDERGHGVGEALYSRLMALLRLQGVHTVYGVVTHPNEKSDRLHERMGFKKTGFFTESGYKNGKWCATSWFEKCIGIPGETPQPIIPFKELDRERAEAVLRGKE